MPQQPVIAPVSKPGRVITVHTNHVAIKQLPRATYYLYTGIVSRGKQGEWREEKHSEKRIRVIDRLQERVAPQSFVNCVFDGMNLLFVPYFPVNMGSGHTPSPNAEYRVTITRTAHPGIKTADVDDLTRKRRGAPSTQALQVINLLQLIIRQHSNNLMKPAVNAKAYFTNKDRHVFQGTPIELWRGYFQSVRPTIGRLLINIDTTVAPFIAPGGVIDFMLSIIGSNNVAHLAIPETHPNFQRLSRAVKNLQITVKFNKAPTKIIRGLEPRAGHFTFHNDQKGRSMSVQSHYHRAHGYRMAYPDIIGLRLTGPSAPNPVIVPAELCTLKPFQFYKRKLDENMTAQTVKFATLKPKERKDKILKGLGGGVDSPIQHYQQSSYIRAAGMVIGQELEQVQGRMLPPPTLLYDQPAIYAQQPQKRPSEVPRGGAWNMVGKRVAKPRHLSNWAAVNFAPAISDGRATDFIKRLVDACQKLGVDPPAISHPINGDGLNTEKYLEKAYGRLDHKRPPLLLIFLPQNAKGIRQRVKHWGDIQCGVITQCVRELKVKGANDQYFNNLGIKLNARLGGMSAKVRSPVMDLLQKKTTMIVGADVSHPGPGQARPSMVSLVYSHDGDAARFNAITDIQDARTERIENMRDHAYRAIQGFVKINNREDLPIKLFPQRVVFYRDGISEGEFHSVAAQEVADFKSGVEKALNKYKSAGRAPPDAPGPEVAYIVVGKRHHVVFFPSDKRDEDGKTGNLPSGFVTDRGLESPFARDFFLQSHSAIQGTSRSSHYVVLHNDIRDFDVELFKQLSFHLCHTYAKATRAVSIPSPVYYADLACARGAFHVNTNSHVDFDSDSGKSIDMALWRSEFKQPQKDIGRMMYFL
ncbi:ribonuclease H-like domain-containing protein [Schizophyllum commune]|nr:Piwi-domain-containing protein [Schizophyllum commune Tattone D]